MLKTERLLPLMLGLMLTACPSIQTQPIEPIDVKTVPCASLSIIGYDSEFDTKETVDEVRRYNSVFRALCEEMK